VNKTATVFIKAMIGAHLPKSSTVQGLDIHGCSSANFQNKIAIVV
jgi:hypothetical protein